MTNRIARVGIVAALSIIAGLEFHRVFGWSPIGGRVLVAAIVPAAVSVWCSHRRVRPGPALLWGLLALLVGLTLVVFRSDATAGFLPGPRVFEAIRDATINGWDRILTTTVPAPANPDLVFVPFVLTWGASMFGSELVLRSRRPLLAVLPPLVAYGLALVFGIGTSGSRLWLSALFLAGSLALIGIVRDGDDPAATSRRTVRGATVRWQRGGGAAILIASCVAAAMLIGPALPSASEPYDPRDRAQPQDQLTAINPLSLISGWARPGQGPALFTVQASRPEHWQLAVLDQYDPQDGWTSSSAFESAGSELPAAKGVKVKTATVKQRVTIGALSGLWLPAASRATAVSGAHVLVAPDSGSIVQRTPLRPGQHYTVRSAVPSGACTTAPAVTPPPSSFAVPGPMAKLAADQAGSETSPCARAEALARYLRTSTDLKPTRNAPSGSSIRILESFLFGSGDGSKQGTSEQYASAFAVLGRALGLDTRVVVGFKAGTPTKAGLVVHRSDALAWPEVNFVDVGWVSFNPTRGFSGQAVTKAEKSVEQREAGQQKGGGATKSGSGAPVERTPATTHHSRTSPWITALDVALGLVAVLLVLLAILVVVVRVVRGSRRRKRRQASDPRDRVLGAWEETIEALGPLGVRRDKSTTVTQVARAAVERLGGRSEVDVLPLGRIVNSALFNPASPTVPLADEAWRHADQVTREAEEQLSRARKLVRLVDPRELVSR